MPASRFLRALFAIGFLAGAGMVGTILFVSKMAWAQQSAAGMVDFDLPAQSLNSALDSYSAVTGIEGVYNGNLTIGRQSNEVKGWFTLKDGLSLLLNGSGLKASYTGKRGFVLIPASPDDPLLQTPSAIANAALAQQDLEEQDYSGLLQSKLFAPLCATPETRPGNYRLAISFNVDQTGQITGLTLLDSTGDQERDAAVRTLLQGLTIGSAPPPYMPQPFTMVMLPLSSGGVYDCPASQGGR